MGDGAAFDPSAVGSAPPVPRGIVDNNPLNLTGSNWAGQTGIDGDWAKFSSPDQGMAAADQNLLAYATKHGINTVQDAVNRWTNNGASPQYVAAVASALGVKPTDHVDFTNPTVRQTYLAAAKPFETGGEAEPSQDELLAYYKSAQNKGPLGTDTNPVQLKPGDPGPAAGVSYVTPGGVWWKADGTPATVSAGDIQAALHPSATRTGAAPSTSDAEPSEDDLRGYYNKLRGTPPAGASTKDNLPAQAASGLGESVAGTVDSAADFLAKHLNPVAALGSATEAVQPIADLMRMAISGKAPATPIQPYNPMPQPGAVSTAVAPMLAPAPTTLPGQIARIGGQFAPGLLVGPGGDAGALGQIATRLGNVVLPAAGSKLGQWAAEQSGADPETQSAVAALGGMLGGGLVAVPGKAGLGALAGETAKPFLANVSQNARDTQAGQILANAAGPGFDTAKSALAGYKPIIEGSPATVGDITGNRGLISLSRAVATKGSTDYAALTGEQSQARNTLLRSLRPNADPATVSAHIRGVISDMDARGQAAIADATDAVTARTNAIGGVGNPEDISAQLQSGLQAAKDKAAATGSEMYKAVDPDGSLTANTTATKDAAKSILEGIPKTLKTTISGEEAAIYKEAADLGNVDKFSELIGLKTRINAAMASELNSNNGVRTPTYNRLSRLQSAMNDNLSSTISDEVVANPTAAANYKAWEDAQRTGTQSAAAVGGTANQPAPAEGAPPVAATGGTALPAGSGSGGVAGTQGVSGEVPNLTPATLKGTNTHLGWVDDQGKFYSDAEAKALGAQAPSSPQGPTIPPPAATGSTATPTGTQTPPSPSPTIQPTADEASIARLKAADAYWADYSRTFNGGPVAKALGSNGYKGDYRLPGGLAAQQFFKSGNDGFSTMQAALKADPSSIGPLTDFAANTFRQEALNADGTVDPAKFTAWSKKCANSIRALPSDIRAQYGDAASASQQAAEMAVAHAAAVKAAQTGAVGKVMGLTDSDAVTNQVGKILGGTNATGEMRELVNATRANPDALAGLQRAVIDHVIDNYISNTEAAASGANKVSANAYQNFLTQSLPALREVLPPKSVDALLAIADDIQQSKRTLEGTRLAGQSNSPQDIYAGGLPHGGKPSTVLDVIGTILGGVVLPHMGIGGQVLGGLTTDFVQRLRLGGINKVNDLVKTAVLGNPDLALALMQKVKSPRDLNANSGPGRALLRALIAPTVAANATKPQPKTPSALEGVR